MVHGMEWNDSRTLTQNPESQKVTSEFEIGNYRLLYHVLIFVMSIFFQPRVDVDVISTPSPRRLLRGY